MEYVFLSTQRSRINPINNFYCFTRNSEMKLAYFSFHWVVVENAMTTNTIDATALIAAEAPAVLPSVTSAPSVLMSTQ